MELLQKVIYAIADVIFGFWFAWIIVGVIVWYQLSR